MADITKSADASMDASTGAFAPQITGLLAGEDLDVAAPCYIKSDGLVYMADGSANDALAVVAGFTPRAVASGQPVTLFGVGARFRYGTGLTPGALYYLSATAGALADAAATGHTAALAQAINSTDIRVLVNV